MKTEEYMDKKGKIANISQTGLIKQEIKGIMNKMEEEKGRVAMLLEFACENHKSVKEEINFSCLAGTDKTHEEYLKKHGKYRVLGSAVIYGANGSGKSNFVNALSFVRSLVINSINHQPGTKILQTPHKLAEPSAVSRYKVIFVVDGTRYAFGFGLKDMLVCEEYLYYFPRGRQTKVYERDESGWEPGDKFKGCFDACEDMLKPNRLFLSCAANFSKEKNVEVAFRFFKEDLVIHDGSSAGNRYEMNPWLDYSLTCMHDDAAMKQMVLDVLRDFDTGIRDVDIDIRTRDMRPEETEKFFPEAVKAAIVEGKVQEMRVSVAYDRFSVDIGNESTGIRKLMEFLGPMLDVLTNGKVMVCDELETGLHEALVYAILKRFREKQVVSDAQLIFTTHDTSLLDLELFRRDQIWFTELKPDTRATQMYSLAEIKNVRQDENVARGYISGKYGAIPMLNRKLTDGIADL